MTETGQNILAGIEQFQKFYQQVGLLLETADEQMEGLGWESRSATCVSGSSSVYKSNEWLPTVLFRMYYNSKKAHLTTFVSVLLGDRFGDAIEPVKEPLLSAGWWDYGIGNKADRSLYWGWTCCHLDHANRKDYGIIITVTDKKWLDYEKHGVVRFSSLAIPLGSVRTTETLRQKVIDPVIEHIDKLSNKSQRK